MPRRVWSTGLEFRPETSVRFVDEAEVAALLSWDDLIPAMRRTMIDFSAGKIEQPARRTLPVARHRGFFAAMPAVAPEAIGAKLLTFYPDNAGKNIDTHMALIALFRPETGEPLAVLDAGLITAMRTAAVTAAFIDAAAAPNVKTLAILGAGVQGESHVRALSQVRRFEEIRIWNRTPERAERLAEKVGATAMGRQDALRGADVVVTATASTEPLFDGRWLRPGAKVAAAGWSGPDGAELDVATMSHVVVVDSREGTAIESGNVRRYDTQIYAELGEVLDGRRPLDPADTVVFDSIGMACQDVAAASLVLHKLGL
jgi:thiomorpholine-carboxylate dehydrogenase